MCLRCGAAGVGVGTGVGVAVGLGVAVAVGLRVKVGLGVGGGGGLSVGLGVAVAVSLDVGVGLMVAVAAGRDVGSEVTIGSDTAAMPSLLATALNVAVGLAMTPVEVGVGDGRVAGTSEGASPSSAQGPQFNHGGQLSSSCMDQ